MACPAPTSADRLPRVTPWTCYPQPRMKADAGTRKARNDSGFFRSRRGITFGLAASLGAERRHDGARMESVGGAASWRGHAARDGCVRAAGLPRGAFRAAAVRGGSLRADERAGSGVARRA